MNTKKFLIGTVVGGIVVFFVGYLLYGVALLNFFNQHSIAPPGSMKSISDFLWGALILANFATGALLTYIILKVGNVNSFGSGAGLGFVIGFLMYLGGLSSSLRHRKRSGSYWYNCRCNYRGNLSGYSRRYYCRGVGYGEKESLVF